MYGERAMLKDRKEDLEDRSHFIGGSDARIVMGGDEDALIALWQQKRELFGASRW